MGVVQRLGHAGRNGEYRRDGQQPVGTAGVRQVRAFEELHGDVGQIMLFARIKNRHDVRMLQTPGSLCLAKEARAGVDQRIAFKLLAQGQRFDGDHTADLGVAALIDHAHGTFAYLPVDLVAAQHGDGHACVTKQARGLRRA